MSEKEESEAVLAPSPEAPDSVSLTPWPEVSSLDELAAFVAANPGRSGRPKKDSRRVLEILGAYCRLDQSGVMDALRSHLSSRGRRYPLGKLLLDRGVVPEEDIVRALCLQNGIPLVNLSTFDVPGDIGQKVPLDLAREKAAVPLGIVNGSLYLAVADPVAFRDRQYFAFMTNMNVELAMAPAARIAAWFDGRDQRVDVDEEFRSLAQKALVPMAGALEEDEEAGGFTISQEDASVVGLVNKIILDAAQADASDIHLERHVGQQEVSIRFRCDGRLRKYSVYPVSYHDAVVSRVKIIAGLDITERRHSQDGKISLMRPGRGRLDMRVVTIPTHRGVENVVIRLLRSAEPLPIDSIGMNERDLGVFRRLVQRPYGLILVTGPTGSGKTTTLHSALREINTPDRKIWTAEDPVEIVQANISQVQVNAKIGWTFAQSLRAFLRADPDVIMIGEMRDQETGQIAVEASMTGHLVLSTLHTNSAVESVGRLLDLGINPFNLSDALLCVMAQRLARRLCPKCAVATPMTAEQVEALAAEYCFSSRQPRADKDEITALLAEWTERFGQEGRLLHRQAAGCEYCQGTGYRGRIAIFEVMEVTPAVRQLVRSQAAADALLDAAVGGGMTTLRQDGIEKVLAGLTDMTEVRAACG